ncbi:MAG: IS30 family transposase [Proteobacteria bacterium]|nr:IS30 family transposase [Pseudomonadota bacterium]
MSHITYEQRYTISCMLKQGYNQSKIGEILGKSKSVISREIHRNKDLRSGEYKHDLAQKKYLQRQSAKNKYIRFTDSVKSDVEALIEDDYSPEQIVGTLEKRGSPSVSHERIYQHIWEDKKQAGILHTHLRRQGRRYRKRGSGKDSRGIIRDRISIDQRPSSVEKRERFGDLEVDLIIGKNHKEAIVTINDRASGVLKMKKVASKESCIVAKAINDLLVEWMPYIHTITSDNGKEFAAHEIVAAELNVDYYFAHPYHSWERGSNENLNGLIRQYIPKKTTFENLTHEYIKSIETKLNNRPRKRYNFETPIFVMENLLFIQKVAFVT